MNFERKKKADEGKKLIELVRRSKFGEVEAFAEIYELLSKKVYNYCFFKVGNSDDAEDLTEQVFLKVWEKMHKFDEAGGNFKAWVFTIAHNLVVDHYRKNKFEAPLDEKRGDLNPENNPKFWSEQSVLRGGIKSALGKLKDVHQKVLVLKYINDLSFSEIAKILKRTEISVRVLKHRALKELKDVLKDMGWGA